MDITKVWGYLVFFGFLFAFAIYLWIRIKIDEMAERLAKVKIYKSYRHKIAKSREITKDARNKADYVIKSALADAESIKDDAKRSVETILYRAESTAQKIIKEAKEESENIYFECGLEEQRLEHLREDAICSAKESAKRIREKARSEMAKLENLKLAVFKIMEERQIGFPWIAGKIADATTIIYKNSYQKREAYKYRESLREIEILKGRIAFHEFIYPHLKELNEKVDAGTPEENALYTEDEKSDESHFWLTPEEFRKLSEAERGQLALERFRKKHMTNWEIGKLYEQYVGFLKEKEGFKVDYNGIRYREEDRGRDLICTKGDEVQIIQCKYWSSSKTIYEKNIFQFFGTVFYARHVEMKQNPMAPMKVRGIFCTTTKLSDFAMTAAKELGVEVVELPMDKNYPCIKCNINRATGEKIYHLPFDQKYDATKIEPRQGEFYASTCAEAEASGFRRAKRHFPWK
nr:MAG TPA: V-type ATP synthase subunit E [Caudoviricetes sp.]